MGRHGLAEPLQKTRLHSFVTEGEFEGCRPKAEALEEAFGRGFWGGCGRSWVNYGAINRSHMLRSKLKAEKVSLGTRKGC